jgi:hypothetical protein
MSTLGELKALRSALDKQISDISITIQDEDQKGLLLQKLNVRLTEIEEEIQTLKQEQEEMKQAKKQARKNKQK